MACSCRRTSHNGKIDGFWRVETVEYLDQTTPDPDPAEHDMFIMVNLELFQLGMPTPVLTGIMSYHKGDDKVAVDFAQPMSEARRNEIFALYGIPSTQTVFEIEKLDSKRLVLNSGIARITCRRF